ncbi:PREDICTED: mas-related G-protein coupled receptor member G [Odobenus rosmarus divergens]|uniref:Mas-related G-protein coupled receptor member G n=1 Tax=Odobenus rosmarus divergens TaxID=9708 RepID=A0A2U3VH49_ODORO
MPPAPHHLRFPLPAPPPAAEPARMLGLWSTFSSVFLYLSLAVGLAGLLGNGLVLWHLGLHIENGPLLRLRPPPVHGRLRVPRPPGGPLHGAGRPGPRDSVYFAVTFVGFPVGLWLRAVFSAERLSPLPDLLPGPPPQTHLGTGGGLIWALTPPAHACGRSPAAAPRGQRHVAAARGLRGRRGPLRPGGQLPRRPPAQFFGVSLGSVPLLFCRSLRPVLTFPLPALLPRATLLPARVHGSAKRLTHFRAGRSPEVPGEEARLEAGGCPCPWACCRRRPPPRPTPPG